MCISVFALAKTMH